MPVRSGPFADRGGLLPAVPLAGGRALRRGRDGGEFGHLARLGEVPGQVVAKLTSVIAGQVDLELSAVDAKQDRLVSFVAGKVVDQFNFGLGRHSSLP